MSRKVSKKILKILKMKYPYLYEYLFLIDQHIPTTLKRDYLFGDSSEKKTFKNIGMFHQDRDDGVLQYKLDNDIILNIFWIKIYGYINENYDTIEEKIKLKKL